MVLRDPNNAATDFAVMNLLRTQVLLPNTQLAVGSDSGTGLEVCYIQARYALSQGPWPALHLSAGPQSYKRETNRGYSGTVTIRIRYYDRWDQNNIETQDQILARIAADLERMKANLEDADELEYNGQPLVISLAELTLSAYEGSLDHTLLPGQQDAVYREMTSTFNVLPYLVAY